MLNSKTNRKGFRLNIYAFVQQHLKTITCAVTNRQHDVATAQRFTTAQFHTGNLFLLAIYGRLKQQAVYFFTKTYLASKAINFCANIFNHFNQLEGADVRLTDVENFLRRSGFHKLRCHFATQKAFVLHLTVQLAV